MKATTSGEMDPEKLKRRIDSIYEEYFSNPDLEEAKLSWAELQPQYRSRLVEKGLMAAIESSAKKPAREPLAKLFTKLYSEQLLSCDEFAMGATKVLDNYGDIVLDVPRCAAVLPALLGDAVNGSYGRMSDLTEALIRMSDATGLAIVSDMVKSWAAASGEERAWKLWRSCGVKLEQFMPPGSSESDVHKHLKDQELLFLDPFGELSAYLREHFALGTSSDAMLRWIGSKMSPAVQEDATMPRAVLTMLSNYLLEQHAGVPNQQDDRLKAEALMQKYDTLLRRFGSDPRHQVEYLLAAQQFCAEREFPSGTGSASESFARAQTDARMHIELRMNATVSIESPHRHRVPCRKDPTG